MQVVAASIVLEVGVIMATIHWVPTGNHLKSFVFLTGLAFAALLAGVVVRALRRQMGLLAERAQQLERERDQQASLAAAAERARIAREMHDVVSHNIQVMVTLADAAGAAGKHGSRAGGRSHARRLGHRASSADGHAAACWACCATNGPTAAGAGLAERRPPWPPSPAWPSSTR